MKFRFPWCAALFAAFLSACTASVHVQNLSDEAVSVALDGQGARTLPAGAEAIFSNVAANFFAPDLTLTATGDWIDPEQRRLILIGREEVGFTVTNNVTWLLVSNLAASPMTLLYVWQAAFGPYYQATSNQLSNQTPIAPGEGRAFRVPFGGGTNHVRAGYTSLVFQRLSNDFTNLGRTVARFTSTNLSVSR